MLHAAGAIVVFGDRNVGAALSLLKSLPQTQPKPLFVQTDIISYEANLHLFRTARSLYNRIDHAITIAGIVKSEPWSRQLDQLQMCKTIQVQLESTQT